MPEPLVSVKMITYNHAPYIAQAIEGVLQQKTNFPFELVIGEDCSTDGTTEIVFEYQKKYPKTIRVITSEQNVGMKENGYRTLKACRGKYIAFCEGDDYWHHPEKLQKQVDFIEGHPECGLVFTDCDVYNVSSNKLIRNRNYKKGFQLLRNLTIEDIIGDWEMIRYTCSAMGRKDLMEHVIENDPYLHQNNNFLMGDLQLWAEIALISGVSYIPESLATYRILDESASRGKDIKKALRFVISGFEIRLHLCDKHKLSENIRRKIELGWCDCSLRLAFYEGNFKLASEVRKKKQAFTWKEWLRYFGAKYLVVNYLCRIAALTRDLFRNLLIVCQLIN
jgi:glycosyltransferase involved in cell wall biosynthesis